MEMRKEMAAIQARIANRLDPELIGDRRLAGVIGESPSQYSKSPALWNAAFQSLGIDAVYLAFDVSRKGLKELTSALRDSSRLLGVNVTVPHKVTIMQFLDELDLGAAHVQAVNTIVRTATGRLVGYNTDGEGFLDSLLKVQPGQSKSFMESLKNLDVLLLGAGGSARALAFHLAERLGRGRLLICNRTIEHALALADEIGKIGQNVLAFGEQELPQRAPDVGLIVNCTTKGQSGVQRQAQSKLISMAPYSALAPAHPVAFPESEHDEADAQGTAAQSSRADIQRNNETSLTIAASIPANVPFYDLIYSPEETVFLRHGRLTGHKTMNGKGMIINQAAISFCRRICRTELRSRRLDETKTYRQVLETMYRAW
ncbi:MAG TPA: shikimate dehydrogenase [Candidatus Binatia bacterium]|nr:shikimate dehydrogenase [Candidatus Binatia bacterium]